MLWTLLPAAVAATSSTSVESDSSSSGELVTLRRRDLAEVGDAPVECPIRTITEAAIAHALNAQGGTVEWYEWFAEFEESNQVQFPTEQETANQDWCTRVDYPTHIYDDSGPGREQEFEEYAWQSPEFTLSDMYLFWHMSFGFVLDSPAQIHGRLFLGNTRSCDPYMNRCLELGGGALFIDQAASASIRASTFLGNEFSNVYGSAELGGGAIFLYRDAFAAIYDSSFVDNRVADGPGPRDLMDHMAAAAGFGGYDYNFQCGFAKPQGGGAIFVSIGASTSIYNSVFVLNRFRQTTEVTNLNFYGRDIHIQQDTTVNIYGSAFTHYQGATSGAYIYASPTAGTPTAVTVVDTTFQPFGTSAVVINTAAGCDVHPCAPGFECMYSNYSLTCKACSQSLVGQDGLRCEQCPPGRGPNDLRTGCVDCTGAQYSIFGVCQDCAPPNVVSGDRTSCSQGSCPPGTMCPDGGDCESQDCVQCPPGSVGLGADCTECTDINKVADDNQVLCVTCGAGKAANHDHSACVNCVGATYSLTGICESCAGIVDVDHRSCTACANGQDPDSSRMRCQCSDGSFNASAKARCYLGDWREPLPIDAQCPSCDVYLHDCVDTCVDESIAVKPGWIALTRSDGTLSVFQCKVDLACDGIACNEGYSGPLCGMCDDGYSQASDGECTRCDGTAALGAAIVVVLLLVTVLLFAYVGEYLATVAAVIDLARELDLPSISKVLVSTMQIITNFSKVLNVPFPAVFKSLLKFLAIFRFDISILGTGCLFQSPYFSSLGANFSVVFVAVLGVGATYLRSFSRSGGTDHLRELYARYDKDGHGVNAQDVQDMAEKLELPASKDELAAAFSDADTDNTGRVGFAELLSAFNANSDISDSLEKRQRAKAWKNSLGRLFLLVFFLYPGLTNQIFEIFLCRDLGPSTSPRWLLHADYGVDCDDTETLRWTLGPTLVLLWPVGVPAAMFALMFDVRAKILAEDEEVTTAFNALIGDYKPQYWYWEIVEISRKLLLSGILSLVNRGSIAQATLGTMISFVFFALHVNLKPYKSAAINVVKTVSEVQLFVVLLMSVILQQHNVGFDAEVIRVQDYGMIQAVATIIITPVIIYLIGRNLKGLRDATINDGETPVVFTNPFAKDDPENSDQIDEPND